MQNALIKMKRTDTPIVYIDLAWKQGWYVLGDTEFGYVSPNTLREMKRLGYVEKREEDYHITEKGLAAVEDWVL